MKKLMRRLSKVADSAQYCLLRSESLSQSKPRRPGRAESFRAIAVFKLRRLGGAASVVPEGHVPVYVGEEMERFVISAEMLNHPVLVELLNKSAQEYGYEQRGALRIPCHALVFERVLEALRVGDESGYLEEFMCSLSADESDMSSYF